MKAFPLSWPAGWPRTPPGRRRAAKFTRFGKDLSVYDGVQRVLLELGRLGVRDHPEHRIISTNLPQRKDGLPSSDARVAGDGTIGVAVYWIDPFQKGDKHRVMAIDHYNTVADNLAAIAATLEAMRAIERHGGAQILERAFAGFDALPAPGSSSRTWRDVLGVGPGEANVNIVECQYLKLRKMHHPDHGGTNEAFHEVTQAWIQAREELEAP